MNAHTKERALLLAWLQRMRRLYMFVLEHKNNYKGQSVICIILIRVRVSLRAGHKQLVYLEYLKSEQ